MIAQAQSSAATDVARYYDRNTPRFLLVGRGRGVHAIHRELWAPGARSAPAAADHINHLAAGEVADVATDPAPVVIDFGCGVGGTLFHLAERFPGARLCGVTLSRRQVEIGRRLARELGVHHRCTLALGDFHTADLGMRADAVLAIESFAHSDDADAFLANAARHLRPGGRLIVADDFLASEPEALSGRQRLRVEQLRAGWRVPAVCTSARLAELAAAHGLATEKVVDLTPLTRPGSRVRDRLIAAVSPLLARLALAHIPFWGNIIGGNALQVGLREGFLRYQLLVLRRLDC